MYYTTEVAKTKVGLIYWKQIDGVSNRTFVMMGMFHICAGPVATGLEIGYCDG